MLKEAKYKHDQYILKILGFGNNKKIKLIHMKVLRNEGVEDENDIKNKILGFVNSQKLEESICRTRTKIFELAYCNPWDYFFTGTLNPKLYNRADLKKFHKDLTKWICNYNKKYCLNIKYLLIPELHSDGKSWHMHGFLHGLPKEHLKKFKMGDKMSKVLAEKVRNGDDVYNWGAYMKKFGFCDLEPIRNTEAVSKYVTKYISKNLAKSVTELNAHMYYRSRGLKVAETIKKGSISMPVDIEPSYSNDYCTVFWLPYSETLKNSLISLFI